MCKETYTEQDNGAGFPGWVIIQGIGTVNPAEAQTYTYECNNMNLCPVHGSRLAELITEHLEGK